MARQTVLGALGVLIVVGTALGGVAYAVALTFVTGRVVPAAVALALVAVVVAALSLAGATPPEWLSNPYW